MRSDNISVLRQTLDIMHRGYYDADGRSVQLRLSEKLMKRAEVFLPDDLARMVKPLQGRREPDGTICKFSCTDEDSFAAARRLAAGCCAAGERVLVLNLANSVHPGGGVRSGANAQEESLCRASSLLVSLEGAEAAPYYRYNQSLHTHMGSDALIISPNVEIIRDENQRLLPAGVIVSVMTCAAPNLHGGMEGMTFAEYKEMLYRRICGILRCAAFLGYQHLVLGAFGCGAFGNDAADVSQLFRRAFREFSFDGRDAVSLFRNVCFAVLDRSPGKYNFSQFNSRFGNYYQDNLTEELRDMGTRIMLGTNDTDKVRGCLLGGAAGDALGYPVEFLSAQELRSRYGPAGISAYTLDPVSGKALISDDTQMTLFTANAILVGDFRRNLCGSEQHPRAAAALAYQDWLRTQNMTFAESRDDAGQRAEEGICWLCDVPALYHRRAPGRTCLAALRRAAHAGAAENAVDRIEHPCNDSKGCGGIMRVAPLALFYDPQHMGIDCLDREGAYLAAITHGHSLGYLPAAVLVHIISRIVYPPARPMTLRDIIREARDTVSGLFPRDSHIGELRACIDEAIALSENHDSDAENIARLGEGWTAEQTLAIAVYCSLRHQDDFSAGIIAAVNHGGDSDLTGAVTGNILGALLGERAIGAKWTHDLELCEVITEMADDLVRGGRMSEYSEYFDDDWMRKYGEKHRWKHS